MKRFLKNEKGSIEVEHIVWTVVILIFIGVIGFGVFKFIFSRTVGNKTAIDMKYKYEKAIVNLEEEKFKKE